MTPEEFDRIKDDPKSWIMPQFNNPNARLMAAAPDLLEALQFALERLDLAERELRYDHKTFDSKAHDLAIDKARAAIAKATNLKE